MKVRTSPSGQDEVTGPAFIFPPETCPTQMDKTYETIVFETLNIRQKMSGTLGDRKQVEPYDCPQQIALREFPARSMGRSGGREGNLTPMWVGFIGQNARGES